VKFTIREAAYHFLLRRVRLRRTTPRKNVGKNSRTLTPFAPGETATRSARRGMPNQLKVGLSPFPRAKRAGSRETSVASLSEVHNLGGGIILTVHMPVSCDCVSTPGFSCRIEPLSLHFARDEIPFSRLATLGRVAPSVASREKWDRRRYHDCSLDHQIRDCSIRIIKSRLVKLRFR
jgi:hypothetical protein